MHGAHETSNEPAAAQIGQRVGADRPARADVELSGGALEVRHVFVDALRDAIGQAARRRCRRHQRSLAARRRKKPAPRRPARARSRRDRPRAAPRRAPARAPRRRAGWSSGSAGRSSMVSMGHDQLRRSSRLRERPQPISGVDWKSHSGPLPSHPTDGPARIHRCADLGTRDAALDETRSGRSHVLGAQPPARSRSSERRAASEQAARWAGAESRRRR